MTRVVSVLANDVRLQIRYGLYAVSVLMVLFWGVLLQVLNASRLVPAAVVVAPFVAINLMITTFYFMAGLVLFEKSEGVLPALVATPLRSAEYLLSKSISLTILAAAETLLIVAFVYGMSAVTFRLVAATLLLGILYSLAGFITVVRFESINRFLVPSVAVEIALLVPLAVHFGVIRHQVLAWHPVEPMMQLMRSGGVFAPMLAIGWCIVALWIARREFDRFVVRQ